ncbi:hypothetical protein [Streptomyces antarcticus]|uniref:hypothetical protein n=1 Tax=Streptomyces antarcticus TaxID=2996458 RepID=UPI00226EE844|nr:MULTISPECIES: hypothetical protein [unclassified Streptomyces]MCY0943122.1 hypothetical protein [Streptomyces sp. H34-AA3]MCZ4087749.1 hypothetical protein [Streptomyces sp. H34-S5]
MPDTNDPLRSLFQEAASAGQPGAALPPVSEIARRGERVRRRRFAGLAVAACLVLAGSGAALASLLPANRGGNLPATTPSAPSSLPTPGPPSARPPQPAPMSTPGPPPATTAGPSSTRTSANSTTSGTSTVPPPARTTEPALPTGTAPDTEPSSSPSNHVTR